MSTGPQMIIKMLYAPLTAVSTVRTSIFLAPRVDTFEQHLTVKSDFSIRAIPRDERELHRRTVRSHITPHILHHGSRGNKFTLVFLPKLLQHLHCTYIVRIQLK